MNETLTDIVALLEWAGEAATGGNALEMAAAWLDAGYDRDGVAAQLDKGIFDPEDAE